MARRNSFSRIQEQSHRISWKFLETPLSAARSVASSGRYSSACFTIISSISYDGIIQPPSGRMSDNLPLFERRIISPPSPRLHKQIQVALPSPGRLLYRTTEAPERSDAVVLPASDQLSRPGPAFGGREGVFRTPFPGEYFALNDDPLPVNLLVSSMTSGTTRSDDLLLFGRRIISPPSPRLHKQIHVALPSPGRLLYRTTEAPERSDAVVLPASDQLSRPGPAFGGREGVFRTPFPGDMPSGTSRPFSMSARLPRGTDDLRLYYQNVLRYPRRRINRGGGVINTSNTNSTVKLGLEPEVMANSKPSTEPLRYQSAPIQYFCPSLAKRGFDRVDFLSLDIRGNKRENTKSTVNISLEEIAAMEVEEEKNCADSKLGELLNSGSLEDVVSCTSSILNFADRDEDRTVTKELADQSSGATGGS
ncbi:uncharacterized protein LOC131676004 [Topomyia yanbarensis]|uniref:uncharacterized protein LOC131676004 n=1 Tax=Topomyia yanbarensis TaxID=2498891 RepID=UPI00273CDD38|nr:uncharacterized protein LOC131676004 [Topomyia yanbarensis]